MTSAEAQVLSRHRTSEGMVSYLRCVCGELTVRLDPPVGAAPVGVSDPPR